jgi:hypothetical protein
MWLRLVGKRAWSATAQVLLAVVLDGCVVSNDPGSRLSAVTLALHTRDVRGHTGPLRVLYLNVWPAPTLRVPVDSILYTDEAGRLTIPLGSFPDGRLDSVQVALQPPGCVEPTVWVLGGVHDDTLVVSLVLDTIPPPMSATPGDYCASGVDPRWGPVPEYRAWLRIDSVVGTTLFGRWLIVHTASFPSDVGSFTGAIGTGVVFLTLVNDGPSVECAGKVAATVDSTGAWGPVIFTTPTGCLSAPRRWDFSPNHFPGPI